MTAALDTPEHAPPLPRRARLAVTILFVIHGLVFASWIVRIPDVKVQLHLTDGQLGLALLGAPVGVLGGQFLVGWLLPKWGSRRLSVLLALAWFAVFPFLGLAPHVLVLMLVLVLYGLTAGGMDVAMNAQAAAVEHAYGQPIMASFHGMWSIAGMVGALAGGWLVGLRVPILVHFLAVVAVAAPAVALAGRGLLLEQQPPAGEAPALVRLPRALLPLGVLAFSVLLCEGAIGDWSAVYLRESLGSPPGLAAAGFVVFSLLMTIGRLTGDWLTMRFGPARIVQAGGVLVLAGMGVILLVPAAPATILGFGLIGAGVACPFPLVISAAARAPNLAPGRAIAAMATVAYAGSFLGPPLIGTVAEVLTLRDALALLVLVGLIMLVGGGRIGLLQPEVSSVQPDFDVTEARRL
jgi:MFS family permease